MATEEPAPHTLPSIQLTPPSPEPEAGFQPTLTQELPTESTSGHRPKVFERFVLARHEGEPYTLGPLSTVFWPHQLTFNEKYTLVSRKGLEVDLVSVASEQLKNIDHSSTSPQAEDEQPMSELEIEPEGDQYPDFSKFWKGVTSDPLTKLLVVDVRPLDNLLTRAAWKTLEKLDLVAPGRLPFDWSMNVDRDLFPNLKYFGFAVSRSSARVEPGLGDDLLMFLDNCPALETAFFRYGGPIEFKTDKTVYLPNLRMFIHESPVETRPTGLLNRLSTNPWCTIRFFTSVRSGRWRRGCGYW